MSPMSETEVMRKALLETTGEVTLLRNNVGAYKKADGSWLKYGVGGKGGSDTIGFVSKVVTQAMVGERIAIFTAVEFKAPGPDHTDPDRLAAQEAFVQAVVDAGGLGGFARSTEDVRDIIAC